MEHEVLLKVIDGLNHGRNELSGINMESDSKAVSGLDKITERVSSPLMIMVMGEFSTGKSTFINALVGKEVAAVNATPTTAVITKICYGNTDKINVHFINGTEKEYGGDAFRQLTSKTGISGEDNTHSTIEYVERQLPLEMLKYVTIIDSPGLNDINERHSEATKKFVHNSDTVFWLFSALQSGSKTEVASMEALSPRLKPIAIINKMDEIDEEEDDPEEFLDNLRIQLKDKVQAVIGISAKYALEGKLEDNAAKAEIGNFKEIEKAIRTLVFPNRDKLKLNSFMDDLGEWIDIVLSEIKEAEDINKENQDIDYSKYLEIKSKLQQKREILVRIADPIIDFTVAASQKYNEQAMYLLGVLSKYGIHVQQDDEKTEQYLEGAAIKNHLLACTCLANFYLEKEQADKAFLWLKKAADQNVVEAQYFVGLCYKNGVGTESDPSSTVLYLKKASMQGYAEAQNELADCYYEGFGIEENDEEAVFWYRKAAEQGHAVAQYELANCYKNGTGCDTDKKEALNWCAKAAVGGIPEAQFEMAENYRTGFCVSENDTTMLSWYKKAAEQGHAEAQNWLGRCYEEGWGTEKNLEEAVFWYQKSANQDHAVAQYNLAVCYEEGSGVPENDKEAFVWYKKAAENGDANAQEWLGHAYRNGILVEQDDNESFDWYEKAAKQGNANAQSWLGHYYQYGIGIEQNAKDAFTWYKKAAENGEVPAQVRLADCYEKGIGTGKNIPLAVQWYQKAADQGNDEAQYLLALFYNEGTGVVKNQQTAFALFEKAAIRGHIKAQVKIANCYKEGVGAFKDNNKAFEWYEKAALQGDVEAQFQLANCYDEGTGVEKNDAKAFEWYEKAANLDYAEAQYRLSEKLIDKVTYDTNEEQRKEDFEESVKWLVNAAENGHIISQMALATAYNNGDIDFFQKDKKKALNWYIRVIEHEANTEDIEGAVFSALGEIRELIDDGKGTEEDVCKIINICMNNKSGSRDFINHKTAYLGSIIYSKRVATELKTLPLQYIKDMAQKGYDIAQLSLGILYTDGVEGIIEKDKDVALQWLSMSADQGNEQAKKLIKDIKSDSSIITLFFDGCGMILWIILTLAMLAIFPQLGFIMAIMVFAPLLIKIFK